MNLLLTILSATMDQLLQFPACILVTGVFMRRHREVPFDLFDAGSIFLALLCVGFLVRRMYISPVRPLGGLGTFYKTPENTVGPSVSWAHLVYDGLWLWFGLSFMPGPDDPVEVLSLGPGFVLVTGVLLPMRLYCLYRHRDSLENV